MTDAKLLMLHSSTWNHFTVCKQINIYVYMCVYVYMYISVCVYIYVYVCIYTFICIYVCVYTGWNNKIVVLKKTTLQLYLKTFIEKSIQLTWLCSRADIYRVEQ